MQQVQNREFSVPGCVNSEPLFIMLQRSYAVIPRANIVFLLCFLTVLFFAFYDGTVSFYGPSTLSEENVLGPKVAEDSLKEGPGDGSQLEMKPTSGRPQDPLLEPEANLDVKSGETSVLPDMYGRRPENKDDVNADPRFLFTLATWVRNYVKDAKFFSNEQFCPAGTWSRGLFDTFTPSSNCASYHGPDRLCLWRREGERHARSGMKPDPAAQKPPKWIVLMGDSNFRRIFMQICTVMKLTSEHGINQFSDRECRGPNVCSQLQLLTVTAHLKSKALHEPQKGVEHMPLPNGHFEWQWNKGWDLGYKTKPFVIWNLGLWELMEKNDDELFLRRITVIVKNKLEEYVRSRSLTKFARIKSLGIWRDDWVFVTTPFVAPIDHKRKGLLTPPRITALNAVLSKIISDSNRTVIDWYKISRDLPVFAEDGYHIDGQLFEVAMDSIIKFICDYAFQDD